MDYPRACEAIVGGQLNIPSGLCAGKRIPIHFDHMGVKARENSARFIL